MKAEFANIVLGQLRGICGDVENLRNGMQEVKIRFGRLEVGVAQVQVAIAEQSVRIDRLDGRIERLKSASISLRFEFSDGKRS
jgi:hypothetical protein